MMNLQLSRSADDIKRLFAGLNTAHDLADLLEVSYSTLVYHLYRINDTSKYKEFDVRKRAGGVRVIRAPQTNLKILQQKLNYALACVYEPKRCAHGFVKGRSTVTNARPHTKRYWVLNVDIVDFFPSINFGRVRGVFMARPFLLNEQVSSVLAAIACHRNELPQGAPSSPLVANIVSASLDNELKKLAAANRCQYSRYADDLTFSTNLRDFPEDLASYISIGMDVRVGVGEPLQNTIERNGFHLHAEKIALRSRFERQEVTGIVVNEKLNVSRSYIRNTRAVLHAWKKFGYDLASRDYQAKYAKRGRLHGLPQSTLCSFVKGKISYLGMVRGHSESTVAKLAAEFAVLRARDGV